MARMPQDFQDGVARSGSDKPPQVVRRGATPEARGGLDMVSMEFSVGLAHAGGGLAVLVRHRVMRRTCPKYAYLVRINLPIEVTLSR